jgi:hypothetical protein
VQPSFAEIEAESGMQISNLGIRVPAPMSEDVNGGESPHDRAWTVRTDRIRVPAPRLELQSGSLNDLRSILYELAKNAKLEMKRGNKGAVEELLEVFLEVGEQFSTFEKNILENGVISCKGPDSIRVDPITNPLILEVTL